jgi:hypothetical protein
MKIMMFDTPEQLAEELMETMGSDFLLRALVNLRFVEPENIKDMQEFCLIARERIEDRMRKNENH